MNYTWIGVPKYIDLLDNKQVNLSYLCLGHLNCEGFDRRGLIEIDRAVVTTGEGHILGTEVYFVQIMNLNFILRYR